MKKTKSIVSTICGCFLAICMIICLLMPLSNDVTVYAYSEQNYQNAGLNFMKEQYALKDMHYDNLNIENAINLYGIDETVVAKILIINRDNELDYVILDFLADDIIAYGYNSQDYLQKFYGKGKIYYAGVSAIAYLENNKYYDIDGNVLDTETFVNALKNYNNILPEAVADGSAGIMDWTEVKTDANASSNSVLNSAWDYIPGFNWTGLKADANGNTAIYYSQTTFNRQYNYTHANKVSGTCGPTAMTNMALYFYWLGYGNALVNGSSQSTFEWFINDLNWLNWTSSNWWTNTKNSFVNYAKNIGYNYDITDYSSPSINNFITQIKNDRPIYTYININEVDASSTNGYSTWAHAVVTVGYEKFTYSYQVNNRWWLFGWHDNWVTKTEDYYYLRCIDGWSTSNTAQYIKYNFYSIYKAIAFKLK